MNKVFLGMAVAFLTASPWAASAMELTMQDVYAPSQTQTIEIIRPWTDSFAEKTGGALAIHYFPVGSVVELSETRTAITSGMLDMGIWAPSQQPRESPYAYLANLPFILKSSQHGTEFIWRMYETFPEFKNDIDEVGELLAMWVGASFGFCSIGEPVVTPGNLAGKRVLTLVAGDSKTIEAFGGIPVFVTPSDAYVGLQRGMGEACFTALPYMKGLRLMEVAQSVTEMPVSQSIMAMSVNRDVWNELTAEQRRMLKESTGKAFSMRVAVSLDKDIDMVNQLFREHGGQAIILTPEQRNVFADAAGSLIDPQTGYWVGHLADCGIPDAAVWMKKAYDLSDSIPDPNAK